MRHYHTTAGAMERPDHPHFQFRGQEPEKIYYRIAEVAELFNVAPSCIRFWLDIFHLPIKKNSKGDRRFTKEDIAKVAEIHYLLKVELYTVEGAKKKLNASGDSINGGKQQ